MVQIQALRGWRYDLSRVGDLSEVVAPPYDVIDRQLQDNLYNRHPNNVVRLILNRPEPGDEDGAVYQRAAGLLRRWQKEGILALDKTPAVHVYHQEYTHDGRTVVRRGFLSRMRLEPFGQGNVFPHERTHARVRQDRLDLTKACRANLSPIFGIFPDPSGEVQQLLEDSQDDPTPRVATDPAGVLHKIWDVSRESVITQAMALMRDRPVYVADGHHRYETACLYREFLEREHGPLPPDHPANYLLMTFVGMDDPGLLVLPTHRLFRNVPILDASQLASALGDAVECTTIGTGTDKAESAWDKVRCSGNPSALALFTAKDETWTLAEITSVGQSKLRAGLPDFSDDWRSLGVSILHELILARLLGWTDLSPPKYVHSVDEVRHYLVSGDESGRDATGQMGTGAHFPLAALVQAATVDDIRRVSAHGERMPAKSTFFYPKLLSGLILNPLE